MTKQIKSIRS